MQIISEQHMPVSGNYEILFRCKTKAETLELHDLATSMGLPCYPARESIESWDHKLVRVMLRSDAERVLLKLTL